MAVSDKGTILKTAFRTFLSHKFKRFGPYLGVEPVMVRLAGELLTTPASHPLIAGFILS